MYLAFAYLWDLHRVFQISVVLSDFKNCAAVLSQLSGRTAGVFIWCLGGGESDRANCICSALDNMLNILQTAS